MKLLLDQNLPRSLIQTLAVTFPGSEHVIGLGLDDAPDAHIYDYAGQNGFTIVSKDSDFRQLSFLHGAPPKVVWLRVGNCTVRELVALLTENEHRLLEFDTAVESLLIVERPTS
ncbi:MAG: DUF5615 family PIN-like protein [Spirochaetaceae bacterium]|nr:DUF5615 family PIN-like protein [Spirochaetaceae bacterium]MDE0446741.1 DUF5615 family PIN-like protein [Spirochaetaceae bacterium]